LKSENLSVKILFGREPLAEPIEPGGSKNRGKKSPSVPWRDQRTPPAAFQHLLGQPEPP